jgi:beta-galactosidase/beta-glucuronidase
VLRVNVFASRVSHGAQVEIAIFAQGQQVGAAASRVCGDAAFVTVPLSDLRLWSPSDPFLYDVVVTLRGENGTTDRVTSYAGIRTLGIDGNALLLNGSPKFQRLVLDQGFYPDSIYTAPSDESLRRDVEISKDLGFDGARLHMRVFEPRFLYWADKLGYLAWGEYPNWGLDVSNPASLVRIQEEWLAVLNRDMNHPSIVGWCPFNETYQSPPRDPNVLRMIYRVTKSADPTRPCIDTSGYVHTDLTDVYDAHCYEQDPVKFAERFQPMLSGEDVWHNFPRDDAPWQGQPYFVSEYGGIWWNPGQNDETAWGYGDRPRSEQEFLRRYRALTEALLFHPMMCGFCYTQLYDVEQEVNGLYTYDRVPKFEPASIRAINQQKAAIEQA